MSMKILISICAAAVAFGAMTPAAAAPKGFQKDWKLALLLAVQKNLKDPDSAKLRVAERVEGTTQICGWVNAKKARAPLWRGNSQANQD